MSIESELVPLVYRYKTTTMTLEARPEGRWAVKDGAALYSPYDMTWGLEPQPSSRPSDFAKHYYPTLEEALAVLRLNERDSL